MNNEIKEILENIKRQNEWNGIEYFKTPLSTKNANKLLDYITNLQQENNNLKTSLDESQEVVIDLQQENERLRKELKQWKKKYGK